MLGLREDIDYRLIYMEELKAEERLRNVYIGTSRMNRPPKFLEILGELVDIEASLFVVHRPEAFSDLTEKQREELVHNIEAEDESAISFVLQRIDPRFVEMFAADLYKMLMVNQYMFFDTDPYDRNYERVYNSSIQHVW